MKRGGVMTVQAVAAKTEWAKFLERLEKCPVATAGRVVLGCALGCVLFLQGCASRSSTSDEPVKEPETSYVYVLGPANLALQLSPENPPVLVAEGSPEDLPVFPTREAAKKWLDQEVGNDRIIAGLWRVYRLEAQWPADVVEVDGGECRMRHPARILPAI